MISLAELQRRIESGGLSAEAAIAQSVEATDAHEKTIGAFVCRAENPSAQSAGPLRGIAVGIKDIIDTADFPTEMGSSIYRGFRPRGDEGQEHFRGRTMRIFVEAMVLDCPDSMIAEGVGEHRLLNNIVKQLPLGSGTTVGQLSLDEQREFHSAAALCA